MKTLSCSKGMLNKWSEMIEEVKGHCEHLRQAC